MFLILSIISRVRHVLDISTLFTVSTVLSTHQFLVHYYIAHRFVLAPVKVNLNQYRTLLPASYQEKGSLTTSHQHFCSLKSFFLFLILFTSEKLCKCKNEGTIWAIFTKVIYLLRCHKFIAFFPEMQTAAICLKAELQLFMFRRATIWNSFSVELRNCPSVLSFKIGLKSALLNNEFNNQCIISWLCVVLFI